MYVYGGYRGNASQAGNPRVNRTEKIVDPANIGEAIMGSREAPTWWA
jgi:hypothetical protein